MLLALAVLLAPVLPLVEPDTIDLVASHQLPSWQHWLGTDGMGRDLLSRVLYGAIPVLLTTLGAVIVGACLAGLITACVRGFPRLVSALAEAIMRVLMSIPGLVLALLATVVMEASVWVHSAVLGLHLVPRLFDAMDRGCDGAGTRDGAMEQRLSVQLWRGAADALVLTCSLGFLRFGVTGSAPGWGVSIGQAQEHIEYAPHELAATAVALYLTLLALHRIADRTVDDW